MVLKFKKIEKVNQYLAVVLEGNSGLHHVNLDIKTGEIICTCIGYRFSKRVPPYCYHCGLVHFILKRLFA